MAEVAYFLRDAVACDAVAEERHGRIWHRQDHPQRFPLDFLEQVRRHVQVPIRAPEDRIQERVHRDYAERRAPLRSLAQNRNQFDGTNSTFFSSYFDYVSQPDQKSLLTRYISMCKTGKDERWIVMASAFRPYVFPDSPKLTFDLKGTSEERTVVAGEENATFSVLELPWEEPQQKRMLELLAGQTRILVPV